MGRKIDSDKVKQWIGEKRNIAIEVAKNEFAQKFSQEWYEGYIEACKQIRFEIVGVINKGKLD